MRVTEHTEDGSRERLVVAALVYDDNVLGRVASRPERDLFASRHASLVAQLCVDYHQKARKAPGKSIGSLVRSWAEEKRPSEEDVSGVERLVISLEYDRDMSSDYLCDVAAKHFDGVRLNKLLESVRADQEAGRTEKAWERIKSACQVGLGSNPGSKFPQDDHLFEVALSRERRESLVGYDGALGAFFGDRFGRDCFVAFMAPEKGSKSFWLLDVAFRAMEQRRRVAWFDAGDMTESQVWERLAVRMAGKPSRTEEGKWPCIIKWPHKILRPTGDEVAHVDHTMRTFKGPLSARQALECRDRFYQRVRSRRNFLRLSCHPSGSLSVPGVRSILRGWELEDWIPDVIVIDYADLLAPINPRHDRRDQINDTWAALRGLSQELHSLVLTASQVKREGYNRLIRLEHTSDDKRKAAHVTGLVGINCTDDEREVGVCRLNWVVRRVGAAAPRKVVFVANCLALAQAAVVSC